MQTRRLSAKRLIRQENTVVLTWLALTSPFAVVAAILLAQTYGWR
jgi:hypothetical protein